MSIKQLDFIKKNVIMLVEKTKRNRFYDTSK